MTLERNNRKLDAIRRQVANDNHRRHVRVRSRVLLLDRPASTRTPRRTPPRLGVWWARLLASLVGRVGLSGTMTAARVEQRSNRIGPEPEAAGRNEGAEMAPAVHDNVVGFPRR